MSRRGAGAARGLTLVEMVLTLTILAIAGGIVYGALSTALRSWEQGFARGREEYVARVVIERAAAQLRSAVPSITSRSGEDAVAFDVREDSLRFVTLLSASGRAPAQVSYGVAAGAAGPELVYREYPWPDKNFFGESAPRREERIPEVHGLKVTASKRPEEEGPTGNVTPGPWSPTDGALPATVTLEIAVAGVEGGSLSVTVPLETMGVQ